MAEMCPVPPNSWSPKFVGEKNSFTEWRAQVEAMLRTIVTYRPNLCWGPLRDLKNLLLDQLILGLQPGPVKQELSRRLPPTRYQP